MAGESITIAAAMPSYQDTESIDTTLYAYKLYNFSKWYVVDSGAHVVAELNPGDTYTPTSSVSIVPYYVEGSIYVNVAPGSLSNASYTATYSGGSGNSNSTFTVPKGTALSITFTFNESSNRSYTITASDGNNKSGSPSSATQTVSYTANSNLSIAASSEEGGTCFVRGTLVTLADGTKKKVEELLTSDLIRIFNHNTGQFEEGTIAAIVNHGYSYFNVMTLTFSDGTVLRFVEDHGLFDLDLNQYVSFTFDTCMDYVGHHFVKNDNLTNSILSVELVSVEKDIEYVESYSVFSSIHLNHVINDMLAISTGLTGFYNFYEYNSDLTYNLDSMNQDIEEYGLYTYSDWEEYISYEIFTAFNFENVKANVEKGVTTKEEIIRFILWFYELVETGSMWTN